MRRWVVWTLVLVAAGALAFFGWRRYSTPQAVNVTAVEAERGPVEATVTNSRAGTVESRRRARLSPEIGGKVVALPHREGRRVKAGDVVLRLEDDVYRAQLLLAEREQQAAGAEAERACQAARRAERELERSRPLASDGIISADLLDQIESQAETAQAACRAAEANAERAGASVTVARTQLAKTVLEAPFDAVVAELSIELGEWTTPSPPAVPVPPVIDLIDPDSLYISAPMDEVDAAHISAGQRARVTVDSYRDRSFDGTVVRVAPYVLDVEEQNRTLEIEVDLDPGAPPLLPGTSADVEVILEVHEDALRVPTAALIEGDRVLVVGDDGVLEERALTLGLRNWDFTEVVDGLAAGEQVVTSLDRAEVRAGALAQISETGTAP